MLIGGESESSSKQEAGVPCREGLHARYQTELIPTAAGQMPGPDDPQGPFLPRVSISL